MLRLSCGFCRLISDWSQVFSSIVLFSKTETRSENNKSHPSENAELVRDTGSFVGGFRGLGCVGGEGGGCGHWGCLGRGDIVKSRVVDGASGSAERLHSNSCAIAVCDSPTATEIRPAAIALNLFTASLFTASIWRDLFDELVKRSLNNRNRPKASLSFNRNEMRAEQTGRVPWFR